jgi:hypothetical protein
MLPKNQSAGDFLTSQKSRLDIEIGQSLSPYPQETTGLELLRLHEQFPQYRLHEIHDMLLAGEFPASR